MLPGAYDLMLYRGDTTRVAFVLWQDAAKTVPVDLSGATAKAQIRERPDSQAVMMELYTGINLPNTVGIAVPPPPPGMKPKGSWDLQVTWPSGDVQTIVAGAMHMAPDVTRA